VCAAKRPPLRRALLEEIQKAFSTIPGIEQVAVNPETGSVVLKYDADRHDDFHAGFIDRFNEHHGGQIPAHRPPPSNEIDALAAKIQQEADFLAEHSATAKAVVDFRKHWDREIKVASGNLVDLKMVLCIGLVGFTVFEAMDRQDARGRRSEVSDQPMSATADDRPRRHAWRRMPPPPRL
jgi:hypothetical protein